MPRPASLVTMQPPLERLDPVGEAAQAGAARDVDAADSVVLDLDDRDTRCAASTLTRAELASAYLATFVSDSATT